MSTSGALLDVKGLSVHFGGVVACDAIDLEVGRGQLVGLVGPNGAGKTTAVDAITGFAKTAGASVISLDGERIDRLPPHARFRRGLARTFQSVELFDDLTLFENVLVTAEPPRWSDALRDLFTRTGPDTEETAHEALALVGMSAKARLRPTELSTGERKLAAVARALAGRPKVLLLDEPAAGLDTTESHQLGRELLRILESGISILLIDHDMSLIFEICNPIYVLEFGKVIACGAPDDLRTDQRVVEAYLGQPDATDIIVTGAVVGGAHHDVDSTTGSVA